MEILSKDGRLWNNACPALKDDSDGLSKSQVQPFSSKGSGKILETPNRPCLGTAGHFDQTVVSSAGSIVRGESDASTSPESNQTRWNYPDIGGRSRT